MNKALFICITILLLLVSACGNADPKSNQLNGSTPVIEKSNTPKNNSEYCSQETIRLDSDAEKYFYGDWNIKKTLGFANSYNDASENPTGQTFIGDKIILGKDFFSSKGLQNYSNYQYELKKPIYNITATCYNSDAFYRLYKIDIPDLKIDDVVKVIHVSDPSTKMSIPVSLSFFIINNNRLIMLSEATIFDLENIND
ncbi:hypothetical protein [Paenibacillus kandeliae]|uniref:hypothetical protein n=1 Tax=Paenibacillus kandeliae TaxID=3231269 RepID=UPI00345A3C23